MSRQPLETFLRDLQMVIVELDEHTTIGPDLYRALCARWHHPDYGEVAVTWRTAAEISGDLLRGDEHYLAGGEGRIAKPIEQALAAHGWTPISG